jgi:hypothetical protein
VYRPGRRRVAAGLYHGDEGSPLSERNPRIQHIEKYDLIIRKFPILIDKNDL